ncbi:MAG: 23S rRNA (uracil(1939)-C(5))-methyltransferase RlmD [Planctomycetes bacterium]|nr:23S rRNA (uracil(1939)-C(5))-methyltransferase RlmD [Planctomycetota bacterium]
MARAVVRIDRLGRAGMGIGTLGDGRTVAVPKTLPGEEIEADTWVDRRGRVRGRLVRVLRAAAGRVPAPCEHFAACGGCQLQHLAYPEQLAHKRAVLVRHLARTLGPEAEALVAAVEPAPRVLGYRNRNLFRLAEGRLGLGAATGQGMVGLEECPLAVAGTGDLTAAVTEWLAAEGRSWRPRLRGVLVRVQERARMVTLLARVAGGSPRWGELVAECGSEPERGRLAALAARLPEVSLHLAAGGDGTVLVAGGDSAHLAGPERISAQLGLARLSLGPRSFVQVNTEVSDRLYTAVAEALAPMPQDVVLDLFCGSGALAQHLAARGAGVYAVDMDHRALADARAGAVLAGTDRIEWRAGRAETIARRLWQAGRRHRLATVNPPRSGMPRDLPPWLPRLGVARLVYVSCSPPTLARDLAVLRELGYRLERCVPFDQFAQTYHLEVVAVLAHEQPAARMRSVVMPWRANVPQESGASARG